MQNNRPPRKLTLTMQLMHAGGEWKNYTRRVALQAGIPEAYRKIIVFLRRFPGVSQKQMAQELRITGAALSRTVNDMERDGYLLRTPDEADKRVYHLFLTETGIAKDNSMLAALGSADEKITAFLGKEREEELMKTLAELENLIRDGLEDNKC